ncbi:ATP-binding protein [Macrococcoides bohemicum]|uniref:ATP-binding protein n=1 Tax=Macrococcoides bohemicum TaxID=1903056 RepID=UPI00105A549A|nr:ATP-binding protein [Macrococcus bohemicus]TDL38276.1 ATP-binding protein [Macrococcus bohemicus]
MDDKLLTQTISDLIDLKYEGSYWDYKQEHNSKEDNHKLLHDIICLANNLENREAYLIIGVDDNGKVVGFKGDSFRRNQQQLNDLVRHKRWEGYGAPNIRLRTINIEGTEVDVIVIQQSSHVPYTLDEDIKPKGQKNIYLRRRTIYTRNQDSNTPCNSAATITEVEQLMRIRLGILPNPIDRVRKYIDDIKNWKLINSDNNGMSWYYLLHPEFTIELLDEEEDEGAQPPNFSFIHINGRSSLLKVCVKYHSTILYWDYARYVDETGGIVIYPSDSSLNIFDFREHYTNLFNYYINGSIKIQLSLFLMKIMNLDNEGWIWQRHLLYVPIFLDEDEMQAVKSLINRHPNQAKEIVNSCKENVSITRTNTNLNEEEYEFVKQDLSTNLMVINKIKEYRETI